MIAFVLATVVGSASTPETTLKEFVGAFNRRNAPAMARLVVGGKRGRIPPEMGPSRFIATPGKAEIVGSRSTMRVKVKMEVEEGEFEEAAETVTFEKVGSMWKIVPVNPLGGGHEVRPISYMAYVVIHPEMGKGPAPTARSYP